MRKYTLLLLLFFVPHKAHAQIVPLEACKNGACYGYGAPSGTAINGYIYQDVSQSPPALYCPKNGAWVACGGSGASLPTTPLILKGNNAGGAVAAIAGTDYVAPLGNVAAGCPLTTATQFCITVAPYNASTAGATTTTTSGTFAVGTSGSIASCSTFLANQGVLITGAGVAAANYIGTVVSCSGTTLTVTPSTSTSVGSGVVVQHDETAAFLAAIAALSTSGGTVYLPDGMYLVNGPLLDTAGANAVLPMPKIANYEGAPVSIAFIGLTVPMNFGITQGAIIQTSRNSGSFFGGFDSATGAGFPNFTNVWLTLENFTLIAPPNSTITAVNAKWILGFIAEHLTVTTNGALPTNVSTGIVFPTLSNNVNVIGDQIAVAGFYNGAVIGEHAHLGSIYASYSVNGFVFDGGTDGGSPINNSSSVDYLWCGTSTNCISAGVNTATVNVQVADMETLTGHGILDSSNLLFGIINYNVPFPFDSTTSCNANVSGGSNLKIIALQCPNAGGIATVPPLSGLTENWIGQEGQGSTLVDSGYDFTNSAAATSVTWTTVAGFTGSVATYNGTSSFAKATSVTNTAFDGTLPFSVCSWFNVTANLATDQFIVSNFQTTNNTGWGMEVLGITTGSISVYLSNTSPGNVIHDSTNPIVTAGTTNLACFAYNGTKLGAGVAIYLNGVSQTVNVLTNTLTGSMASTSPAFIGAFGGTSPSLFFGGAIGRTRIWNRLLSASEMSAVYAAGSSAF